MEYCCGHIYITKEEGGDITFAGKTFSAFNVTTPEGKVIDTYDFIYLGEHLKLDIENNKVRIYPDICHYLVYDDEKHKVYGVAESLKVSKDPQVYAN